MYQLIVERDRTTSAYFPGRPKKGDAVWVRDYNAARELVAAGICSWPQAAPSESKALGGPAEKK